MEKFLEDMRAYAHAVDRSPQHVLRQAIGASWSQWKAWEKGQASPTLNTVDRLRAYMAENPPPAAAQSEGAA